MKFLILGGAFNPIHIGHLILAEELAVEFGYDRVLLVPSFQPPHKVLADDPGPDARLAMLKAAVSSDPLFVVETCELERGGVSYTVDTLDFLNAAYSMDGRPGLVIGDDLASGFPFWRDPEGIVARAELILARRSGCMPEAFAYPHRFASNLLIPVSSTLVRQRVSAGGAWRHLVPDGVAAYIAAQRLYGHA
ncbi:MAG: nicotinate (nicotinamide) nucleotide adenylyltransferase [Spirochaetota bacterium]